MASRPDEGVGPDTAAWLCAVKQLGLGWMASGGGWPTRMMESSSSSSLRLADGSAGRRRSSVCVVYCVYRSSSTGYSAWLWLPTSRLLLGRRTQQSFALSGKRGLASGGGRRLLTTTNDDVSPTTRRSRSPSPSPSP